jgi:hypothetical protein
VQVLQHEQLGGVKNSIFRNDLIDIPGNEWMLSPLNEMRDVNFCVISLKPLPEDYKLPLNRSLETLRRQSFRNWHAVFFVRNLSDVFLEVSPAVRLAKSSEYEGLNLQRAATAHCQPGDIAVVLDYDESFGHSDDLSRIAAEVRNRSVFGVLLSAKVNGSIYKAQFAGKAVRRRMLEPNLALLQEVAHCFRVFSVAAYRLVPHMSLHDGAGRYYARELPLLTLL